MDRPLHRRIHLSRLSQEVGPPLIDERPTSLALEAEFWQYIREISFERKVTQGQLISVINRCKRNGFSLASAIRVFVAQHYRGEQ